MTNRFNAASVALLAACLATTPALAAERSPVQVRIARSGMDFTTPRGRAAFTARVRRAAYGACTPIDATLAARLDAQRCRGEMMRDADVQVAALVRREAPQVASAQ